MSTKIELQRDEPIQKALGRFKKACDKDGILSAVRRGAFYEKPSEQRRRRDARRRKNILKGQLEAIGIDPKGGRFSRSRSRTRGGRGGRPSR